MKLKFFKKLFFTVACVIIASLMVTLTIVTFVISNYFSKEKYKTLDSTCKAVSGIVLTDMTSSNFKRNIYNIINVQNDVSGVDIFVTDAAGKVVVCGCQDFLMRNTCKHSAVNVSTEIIMNINSDGYKTVGTLNGVYDDDNYIFARQVKSADNSVYGYVFSATSTQSLRSLLKAITRMYFFSSLFPLIIMFFILYAMTYKFLKPLQLMSDAAKSMSKGDFSQRIPIMSDDEIGELCVSFNNMTDSLAQLENMRRSFIGNVSHELRTPMTTIAGFIDGIIDGTIEKDKQDYYLKIVSDEVKRLSRVVKAMLDLAKLEAGEIPLKPTDYNISEQIVNVVLSRENQIDAKHIEIINLDKLKPAYINADYDLIYQVIYNLVDNAVKFTNDGGSITFDLITTENTVQFSIKNTGKGIPKENLSKVFERFYKGDKSRSANTESTGIGLYIVKTIINIHGGKIAVDSVENDYTVFKVMLPIKKNN